MLNKSTTQTQQIINVKLLLPPPPFSQSGLGHNMLISGGRGYRHPNARVRANVPLVKDMNVLNPVTLFITLLVLQV